MSDVMMMVMTGTRGRPGTTTSGREATTGMEEEEEEVTTPAAPAGGQPRPGPRHTGGRTTEARGHACAYTQTKSYTVYQFSNTTVLNVLSPLVR